MPGFVKTPRDEKRWEKAKQAASKQTSRGSEGYWKLSNYIYHKMGKAEEDRKMVSMYKKELQNQGLIKTSGIDKLSDFLANKKARTNLMKDRRG